MVAGWLWAAAALVPVSAPASSFLYNMGDVYSGTEPTPATGPWTQALFEDVAPGEVRLTLSNPNLTGNENVDEWYFNLNPSLNPANLVFTFVGESGSFSKPQIKEGANRFKAGGGGEYDIRFQFAEGGSACTRFTAGESVVYDISGIPNLDAADFAYLSAPAGGAGPFYAAAHVQRIGCNSASAWLAPTNNEPTPVPEPGPTLLCLLAGGVWLVLRWAKRRTTSRQ